MPDFTPVRRAAVLTAIRLLWSQAEGEVARSVVCGRLGAAVGRSLPGLEGAKAHESATLDGASLILTDEGEAVHREIRGRFREVDLLGAGEYADLFRDSLLPVQ